MKKIYLTPKVKTVVLGSASIMAGSITYGGLGEQDAHGQAKPIFFEEDEELF